MSNSEMNTAGQERAEEILKAYKKMKNKKLKEKLSKREQGEYRYFGNDGE